MKLQKTVEPVVRPGSAKKWRRVTLLAMLLCSLTFMVFVASVSAEGAVQVSGIGYWPEVGECDSPSNGQYFDYSYKMTGDLEGCVYVTVETFSCTSSGVYIENGTEFLDIEGGTQGVGTFVINYRFQGKYEDCTNPVVELFGGCQHPIALGSGTDDFYGVTGRLDFRDDVPEGNFPYKGHLSW